MLKSEPSFNVTIACGLREGYDGPEHTADEAVDACRAYCDEVGYCVSVTPTTFVYKGGQEPGVLVGLINYPRFPQSENQIRLRALEIAGVLKGTFRQNRVSVVFPDVTVLIDEE